MAVFVTGGTGFVGVNLIRNLIKDGETVRVLVRPSSPRVGLDGDGIEFAKGDVTDYGSVLRGMEGCDRAYHLAGWVQITPWGMTEARRINVDGTDNVCRACLEHCVKRLVHTSSIAAVGHGPIDEPADENTAWNLDVVRAPYYTTKHEGERVVRGYVQKGLDAVIVNPSYVVGPYDIKPTGGRVILKIATRSLPGYPATGGIGFVDVREVVEGMRLAMERGRRGERYILNGENLSYGAFARLAADVAAVTAPTFAAHYALLYTPAMLATLVGWLHPSWFTNFNLTVLRTGFCNHYVSAEKARRELGVRLHPIQQAIADALAWFHDHDYVRRTNKGWELTS